MDQEHDDVGFILQLGDVAAKIDLFVAGVDALDHFVRGRVIERKFSVHSDHTDANAVYLLDDVRVIPVEFIGTFFEDVAVQDRELRLFELLSRILPPVIKLVIADARGVEPEIVHRVDDRLALSQRTYVRAGEIVARVEIDRVRVGGLFSFDERGDVGKAADQPRFADPRDLMRFEMGMQII